MRLGCTVDGALVRVERDKLLILDHDGDLAELLCSGVDPTGLGVRGELPADTDLDAPLRRPGKILAIGLNYLDHIREAGIEPPESPAVFAKWPSTIIGPTGEIVVDRSVTNMADYEVELAVVIGRTTKGVAMEHALDSVFGYTIANDVSARDIQAGDPQLLRAKSLDTFCPLGPVVVTADEIPDPQALRLWTKVNGETTQDSSTAEMLFGVAHLVSWCSTYFTLEPGDLLMTGTPNGVGVARNPQVLLKDGDLVEMGIEGIGELRNPVRDAA